VRSLGRPAVAAVAACAAVLAPAVPAAASAPSPAPAQLPGVPGAALLAHGRVLVLRPHRLELAVDGHMQRAIPVRQPLDLGRLPDVVGDPAFAVRTAPGVVRLSAVLLQRPDTVVEAGPLTLELADAGGAGPARLSGTRAALRLNHVTITALPGPAAPSPLAVASMRYLHRSEVTLQDVSMRGLGTTGPAGTAALRSDGDGRVRLVRVTLADGGRGVRVDQPQALDVEGLRAQTSGAGLTVVGAEHARLSGLQLQAGTDALVMEGSQDVVVQGSELRAWRDAVRVSDSRGVVLDGVATVGAVRGAVTVRRGRASGGAGSGTAAFPARRPSASPPRTPWSPVRGAGAVALLVLAGGLLVEIGRSWRRRSWRRRSIAMGWRRSSPPG
jgi:hypothetical protein